MECAKNTVGKLRNMTSIYLTCGEEILLLYRQGSRVVNNVWTGSAGGHFEPRELNDAKACVLRELYEELHITEAMLDGLSLRYITLRLADDEIRQNYYFFAELKNGADREFSSNEGTLKWFHISEITELPMPYTARCVVEHWLKEGRDTSGIYCGIAAAEQVVFHELAQF